MNYHHAMYPPDHHNSPHSPNSDVGPINYHGHGEPPNGHIMNSHHEQLLSQTVFGGGPLSQHPNGPNSIQNYQNHLHHHHLINHSHNINSNSNNSNSNQNNMNVKCAACGHSIKDRWIFKAMDRHWHNHCLKCTHCNHPLADMGSSFYTKDNMILCRTDYYKIFGHSGLCSRCRQTIPAHEMVMRAGSSSISTSPTNTGYHHVFHLQCFACSKCNTKLIAGDRYYLLGDNLVCEQDWHKLMKSSAMPAGQQQTAGTTVRKGKVGRPRRSRD